MNGFYTCLLGNAVTAIAVTQPLRISVVVLIGLAVFMIVIERAHIEHLFLKSK